MRYWRCEYGDEIFTSTKVFTQLAGFYTHGTKCSNDHMPFSAFSAIYLGLFYVLLMLRLCDRVLQES